ncbi:MAG: hypothetical protein EOP47_02635 [Sphingobacteriaceae bacterium]|nr:MAG: hypothetical protein EOP47_02635 [Sphingobacteriaceae bacterium]
MKNILKLLLILSFITVIVSCKKNNVNPETIICFEDTDSKALFTEQADVNMETMSPVAGEYRLFWYEINSGTLTTKIYIKAPMEGNSFSLNNNDINSGKVIYIQSCPNCNLIPVKAVGGSVKGENRYPGKRADQTRWLLEAKIILQGINTPMFKDSIYFKRDFTPNFVYN